MASAQELLKHAILGTSSRRSPGVRIKAMGEECANEILMNPSRDRVNIVVERARTAGLNRNQIARLVEVTNHAMMQPVLRSRHRAQSRPIVNKKEVYNRMGLDDKQPPPQYKHNEFSSSNTYNQNQAAEPARMPKTAAINKLAHIMCGPGMEDYSQEPMSLNYYNNPFKIQDEAPVESKKELDKMASYAIEARENAEAEESFLDMQIRGYAQSFAKVASQYVLEGTPFEDVVAASIHHKPDKTTISMLKMAANSCAKRGLFVNSELGTWIDSLDYIKDSNPAFDKMAGIGVPVSDSYLAKDLKGRVRVLNGDSQIIRMLDTVGQLEDRIRKARLIKEQIPDKVVVREHKRKVTNASDY